jgi:hypothetical protein
VWKTLTVGEGLKFVLFFYFNFHTAHFLLCVQLTNKCTIFSSVLLYFAAPTCFDMCVSSSGNSSVPAELYANRIVDMTVRYTLRFGSLWTQTDLSGCGRVMCR